jgi:hypothetical protein
VAARRFASTKDENGGHAPLMTRGSAASQAEDLGSADADQIAERLSWTPRQRLRYLLDMLDFEDRARRARRIS